MVTIWLMMVNNNLVGGKTTPLKNMSQLGVWHSQLNGKVKVMFQTTNQIWRCPKIGVPPGIIRADFRLFEINEINHPAGGILLQTHEGRQDFAMLSAN